MHIVFLVVCEFPYGSASSIRALNICRLLQSSGHSVHVISDKPSATQDQCDCCSYEAVYLSEDNYLARRKAGIESIRRLAQYCNEKKVDAVLTNARYDRFNKLIHFCKMRDIRLFVESCEWYDPSSFKLGRMDFRYWKNQWMLTQGFKKADGFISISRLLDEHNRSFGIPSVRIPTIMDVKNSKWRGEVNRSSTKIRIVYTGNCRGSKENLKPMIEILAQDAAYRERIEFHIYGASKNAVLSNIDGEKHLLDRAGASVVIHGKIPQTEIQNVLLDADFQFFLRPDRRSSHAGFPTKLGESMCVGTPVIANQTGDICLYLKNGLNGYLVQDVNVRGVQEVLDRILQLTDEQRTAMRLHVRQTAENAFDYRKYIDTVKTLIGDIYEDC